MAINVEKAPLADMTYAEMEAWHAQYPAIRMKPNQATYILWKDGLFMGEGDFFHKQADGTYQYSHTVDYGDPHEYPETTSGDFAEDPQPDPDAPDPGDPDADPDPIPPAE